MLPRHINQYFPKHATNFPSWLITQGCSIEPMECDTEILRFDGHLHTGLVLVDKTSGKLRWTHEAERAFDCYSHGKPYDQNYRFGKKLSKIARQMLRKAVVKRDGNHCAICGLIVQSEEGSIEHFISVSKGGPSTLENLVLAHATCNQLLGDYSIKKKLELIIEIRRRAANNKNTSLRK